MTFPQKLVIIGLIVFSASAENIAKKKVLSEKPGSIKIIESKRLMPFNRQQIILGPESFEGSFPPAGWSQFSWSSSSEHWFKATDPGHQGSYVAWINYDPYNTQDEVLQTPSLDLSQFVACTLSFYFWQDYQYEDILYLGISLDGGGPSGTWEWLGYLYQTGCNYDEVIVDLSDYCGYSDVVIGFDYYTDIPDQYSEGIDYVTVYAYEAPPPPKQWSIFVFMNGDNNLEGAAIGDINEMERAVDTSKYNLIVEFDRIPGYDNSNGDWTSTRDYRITYDSNTDTTIRSQMLVDHGELNMGDPNTLVNFVNTYADQYPADHYLVILWDHGDGWYNRSFIKDPLFKGIGPDETNNDVLGVANHEYYDALDAISAYIGAPIDILAHDACLMGMQEVAYEARNFVNYLVFSEHTEPGYGYPYTDILNWLNSHPNATPQQLSSAIVNLYVQSYQPGGSQYPAGSVTQSAITTGASFQSLTQKINIFAQELINAGGRYQSDIMDARYYSQEYPTDTLWPYYRYIDLYDFAQRIKSSTNLPASLRASADSVMAKISSTVIAEGHYTVPNGWPVDNSHGISIYYPEDTSGLNYDYAYLHFTNDYPKWWDFLQGATEIQEELHSSPSSTPSLILTPNPMHNTVAITYNIPYNTEITLQIFDITGRIVKKIFDKHNCKGRQTIYWDGTSDTGVNVPDGIYFCRIVAGEWQAIAKIVLLK